MILKWWCQLFISIALTLLPSIAATARNSSATNQPHPSQKGNFSTTKSTPASADTKNPSAVAASQKEASKANPKMPKCAKQCTWNKGANKANQCWTYLGTGKTQGQVVGYDSQTINGAQCRWNFYLKGDLGK